MFSGSTLVQRMYATLQLDRHLFKVYFRVLSLLLFVLLYQSLTRLTIENIPFQHIIDYVHVYMYVYIMDIFISYI
jgi:hypothetical protein